MSRESILLAKIAALKKNFDNIDYSIRRRCYGSSVEPLFTRYTALIDEVKKLNPDIYGDVSNIKIPNSIGTGDNGSVYEKHSIEPLVQSLDYILEVNSNMRVGSNMESLEKKNRAFLSHGRSNEWYKVQSYLEKDLHVHTLELAQEPNMGRTVLQKLNEESEKCSIAVIIMTGEDVTTDGEIRVRENVLHEIGYFQGKFGLDKVVLLHENGVNIPSNIHGLVYIGFPKDSIESSYGALMREMKVLLN